MNFFLVSALEIFSVVGVQPTAKGLVLPLLAFFSFTLYPVSFAADNPPIDWATFVDAPTGVSLPNVVAAPSNEFYLASQGERPLIKYAADHSIAWEIKRAPGSNDLAGVLAVDVLSNNDSVGIFWTSSQAGARLFGQPVNPNGAVSLARLNPQGFPSWVRPITNGWAYAIAATPDGGYALSGYGSGTMKIGDTQIEMGAEGIFLAHFGTSLDWNIIGRTPGWAGDNAITAIRADDNGNLYIAGQIGTGQWSFGGTNLIGPAVFLGKMRANGTTQWLQSISNSRKFRALAMNHERLVIAWSDGARQEFVGDFSMEGVPGWKTPIAGQINSLSAGALIAITGYENVPPNWFLHTLDQHGNLIWRKGERGRTASVGHSVIELADGDVIFAGDFEQPGIFFDDIFVGNVAGPDAGLSQAFVASVHATRLTPQFRTHPASQKAIAGEVVSLSADIYSSVPLSVRWYKDNQLMTGETAATLRLPSFQSSDAGQYELVAENEFGSSTSRVAQLALASVTVTTLAGSGIGGFSNDIDSLAARFNSPRNPAILPDGSLIVSDSSNHLIRRIEAAGVSTYAGKTNSGLSTGAALEAQFSNPLAVASQWHAVTGEPEVYVADAGNNGIRTITVNESTSAAIAVYSPNGTTTLQRPTSVATHDGLRYILISEENGTNIWKIQLEEIAQIAGSGPGFADGPVTQAKFAAIAAVAVDAHENIYIADRGNHRIRKMDVLGNVTTIAGTNSPGFQDGQGFEARFNSPSGLAVDSIGNIFVTEIGNNSVRKISPAGNVTTLTDQLHAPEGLAIRADGTLVIADTGANQLRELRFETPTAETPLISITRQNGLTIQISGPPGDYWIESTDQLSAPDWQFESSMTLFTESAEQVLFEPNTARFYRARRIN